MKIDPFKYFKYILLDVIGSGHRKISKYKRPILYK